MGRANISVIAIIALCTATACQEPAANKLDKLTTVTAAAWEECTLQSSDGAAITVPAEALTADATITIERNPLKATTLPPQTQDVIALSDFYDFRIADAEVLCPVSITLPVALDKIPTGSVGFPVIAFLTEGGWYYKACELNGSLGMVKTDILGDPLIMWHVTGQVPGSPRQLPMSSSISPAAGEDGQVFQISGYLESWPSYNQDPPDFTGAQLHVWINGRWNPIGGERYVDMTANINPDGSFAFSITPTLSLLSRYRSGMNYLELESTRFTASGKSQLYFMTGYVVFLWYPKTSLGRPSNLVAYSLQNGQVELAWRDNSDDEIGFSIERKTGSNGIYSVIAYAGADSEGYFDSSVSPATTYYYRVRAYNGTGNSAYSNQDFATTVAGNGSAGSIEGKWLLIEVLGNDESENNWTYTFSNGLCTWLANGQPPSPSMSDGQFSYSISNDVISILGAQDCAFMDDSYQYTIIGNIMTWYLFWQYPYPPEYKTAVYVFERVY